MFSQNHHITLFFDLLQVALGARKELVQTPSEEEWRELFKMSRKQTLLGIAYVGIEKLPAHQRPPRKLLLQWYGVVEQIKQKNEELNRKSVVISRQFRKDGFRNLVLKGASVTPYYKVAQLDQHRTPGDVDIWLDASRKSILAYVRRHVHDSEVSYHHVDFCKVEGIDVEVHFMPSWMNNYFTNRRIQQYFELHKEALFAKYECRPDEIPAPSLAFNRVYILVHIYRHLFQEGIGLRQLMDYYFVLRQGFTEEECEETMRIFRWLKMERFVESVMWVLQEVFGIEKQYLLTSVNEKEGRFLLNEILMAGNFGWYDEHLQQKLQSSVLSFKIHRALRVFRFLRSYPSEVLWSPLFKVWHLIWRMRQS